MFKKTMLCSLAVLFLLAVNAQTIKTPATSSTQTIKQDLGIGSVELSYSRPNVKTRKIFGDLVPFGQVWRTGANQATTLTFSDEVLIGGTKVPAGKYGFVTIPDKNEWTLILTKQLDVTNPSGYKQEDDIVRVKAKPVALATPTETFTMQFANVKATGADLQLSWDNTAVTLPITTDVDKKVMAQIEEIMNKDNRPYFQAALYYLESGKDVNQALAWLDKAAEQQPNAFWVHHQRANALAKLGRKQEAKQTAQKSMELARQQKNEDYVRLNEKLIASLN
jgi:hypothetical protein